MTNVSEIEKYERGIKALNTILEDWSGYILILEKNIEKKRRENLTFLDFLILMKEGQESHLRDFIKAEIHERTGRALGFEEKGLDSRVIYAPEVLEECGLSLEEYQKTYESLMKERVRKEPIVGKLFPEYLG